MGISVWQLLIVLAIVLVLFGAKRLRGLGSDLGSAIKGFRGAMREQEEPGKEAADDGKLQHDETGHVINGEVTSGDKKEV